MDEILIDPGTLESAVIRAALDAVIVIDGGGIVREFNPAAERTFGRTREQALGRDVAELIVPERYHTLHRAGLSRLVHGDASRLLDRRVQLVGMRASGEEFPAELAVARVSHEPPAFAGFIRDLSEQRRAEAAELDSRLRLEALLDGGRTAIYVKRGDGRYMLVNREYAAIFGRTAEEMLGQPPDARTFGPHERQVLETGEAREDEEVVVRDGNERVFLCSKFPLRDAQGDAYAVCSVATDITAQKAAEREARIRAAQQTEVARLGTLATGDHGLGDLMDEALQTLAEVLGVEYTQVLECDPDGQTLRLRAGVGLGRDLVETATETTATDGQAGYTLRTGFPVVVDDLATETRFSGATLLHDLGVASGASVVIKGDAGAFGVLSAHSTRRRPFSADDVHFLQAIASVLATAVARVRGAELERQLHQSQRLESLGQLAGGIAHDFNNLLGVILNYADFLDNRLAGRGDEELRADAAEIGKAAKQASDLTRQLLAFSRREVLALEVFSLNDVVEEGERLLRRTLGSDIELRVALEAELWPVRAGTGQVQQILMNLAVNARDAMPDGGILTMKTDNVGLDAGMPVGTGDLAPGRYVRLTVADSGTGMTPDVMAKAFDPFFTTKPHGHGTGLGLATVYGAVQEHGGQIQMQSSPGRGTTFEVYLPASLEPARDHAAITEDVPTGHQETILVVEDEDGVRELTRRILSGHGYRVVTASHAESAKELGASGNGDIDLLLTDVVLPGRSGVELSEEMRRARPGLPVLFMSGYTGEAISRRGMLGSELNVLPKPFTVATLLRRVHKTLAPASESADRPGSTTAEVP